MGLDVTVREMLRAEDLSEGGIVIGTEDAVVDAVMQAVRIEQAAQADYQVDLWREPL